MFENYFGEKMKKAMLGFMILIILAIFIAKVGISEPFVPREVTVFLGIILLVIGICAWVISGK